MPRPRFRNVRALGICAAISVGASLGLFVPMAAAAPSNDLFANRAPIPSTLPAEVEGSNVGATAEEGEMVSQTGRDAHHSIWWVWEAPVTHLVTVDTCNPGFRANVGVFTGENFSELQRLASGEAPECGYPSTYLTFLAVAGTKYDIGADGNFFYPDPAVHLTGEGQIKLQIALRPPPANDAFESPAGWERESIREHYPHETSRDLLLDTPGSNYGATQQPGEPLHGGRQTGASVWFRFTPSESGPATLGFNSNGPLDLPTVVAIYTGESLTGLTPVATKVEPNAFPVPFFAEANRTYHIAVAGLEDPEGKIWEGDFSLHIDEQLPDGKPPSTPAAIPPAPVALAAPKLGKRKIDVAARSATFRFSSSTAGARFRCKLDKKSFRACSSPYKVGGLALGKHRLAIVTMAPGRAFSKPTVVKFALPSPARGHHPDR